MDVTGLVVVDKATGCTSHDVVARLRKAFGQRRIGHAGTLDPDATGVLLVGLGRATRLLRFLSDTDKQYRGTVVFGVATDTLDAAGAVVERAPMSVTRREVEAATERFVGVTHQVPPMVSALKVGGRRLHELARAGAEVERAPRPVRIERIDVEEFVDGPYPEAVIRVVCGSGTYVRSLAADIGAALGGLAHLRDLRRLAVGSFTLDESSTLEEITSAPSAAVLSPAEAMRDLEAVSVDEEVAAAVGHGSTFPASVVLGETAGPGPFAFLDPAGRLLAVYERHRGGVKPAVVLGVEEVAR